MSIQRPLRPTEDRIGIYGAAPRYTSQMLRDVRYTGVIPKVDANWRAQAQRDFAYWKAGALVVAPGPHADALRRAVTELVGRGGKWADGVWVWDLHQNKP
jgi:dolichyl-phosphate beta-glucosyltransferase